MISDFAANRHKRRLISVIGTLGVHCKQVDILVPRESDFGVEGAPLELAVGEETEGKGLEVLLDDGEARKDKKTAVK